MPKLTNETIIQRLMLLYNDTITRETILEDAGYNIVSVWESDIR